MIKQSTLVAVAAMMLLVAAISSAATISLDPAAGWKANFDATSPDPTETYPCALCPPIGISGANFEAANPGWRTVGYDDSGWASYSGGWFPADGTHTPMYLRRTFSVNSATFANFQIIVDDDFMVWVNGTLVPALDDESEGCCTNGNANILSYIHDGANVIAVKADNMPGGGYSIDIGGSVVGDIPAAPAPEPASLLLVGFGLAGLHLARRRKR